MSRVLEHLESAETDFLFFSQTICPYCTRAERTLDAHGLTTPRSPSTITRD